MADLLAYEDRLYPNQSSQVGFLAPGQKLQQVLEDDRATAAKYGVTLYQVGCVLERMVRKYHQGEYMIDDIYRIIPGISTCGYQECPFEELDPEPITYGRSTIIVEKIATGEIFRFESLVAHLVKDHGFCEGPGTPYRLDLEEAIRFFEIRSEIDYTPILQVSKIWKSTESGSNTNKYLKFRSLALAEFTTKYFIGLLFPINLPHDFEIKADGDFLEILSEEIQRSENSSNEFAVQVGFPVKSPEAIQQIVQEKVEGAKYRKEQFERGILEKGLILILIASKDLKLEQDGLIATPLADGAAHFQVPSLEFDVTEKYFYLPSYHKYQFGSQTSYL
jgi:hypothetical protein